MPTPLGLVEPLPFKVTVSPTFAVWLAPALATGGNGVVWNVHCRFAKSKGTVRLTRMVKVLLLVTCELAGTGAKVRVFWPSTMVKLPGFRVSAVANTAASGFPVLRTSAW